MKYLRHPMTALVALMLVLVLATGCAKKEEQQPAMEAEPSAVTEDTTAMTADTTAIDTSTAMEHE